MAGRIAIPIHDAQGAIIAYAGRWPGNPPEGEPKYKLPRGFKKSLVLYNLHRVLALKSTPEQRLAGPVIVVEGYWSVFRLTQLGYPNVVALMGSTLSSAQARLQTAHVDRAIVIMDGDPPGRQAQAEIVDRLARHLWIRGIELPDGADPDTMAEDVLSTLRTLPR